MAHQCPDWNLQYLVARRGAAGTCWSDVSGVNGLRVLPGKGTAHVYFSNQGAATFNRFDVTLSTLRTSTPEVIHKGVNIDDFALDPKKRVAYVASSKNSVVQIPLDGVGEVKTLFGGLNETVLAGPTSVQLGRGWKEEGKIYVSTNGGLNGPVDGYYIEGGKVEEVDVGC